MSVRSSVDSRDSRRHRHACAARVALLFVAWAAPGCLGPSRDPPTVEPSAPVPLIYDARGALFVDALVEGRPARLLLDTGASCSTLAHDFASALPLAIERGDPVEGTAGVVESERALATIALPGCEPARVACAVYDFARLYPACVGILGSDVLRRRPFRIDYRRRELAWDADAPADAAPLELDHGIPRTTIAIGGVALDLRIDTGAALAPGAELFLNVTRREAAALGLSGPPAKRFTATGTGGATLDLPVHRVRDVVIGPRRFAKAWAIVQPEVGYFVRPDAVGFLGNSALDKLDPWFDYEAGLFGVTRRE